MNASMPYSMKCMTLSPFGKAYKDEMEAGNCLWFTAMMLTTMAPRKRKEKMRSLFILLFINHVTRFSRDSLME